MLWPDSVNLFGGPVDRLVGVKIGDKSIIMASFHRPERESNLHRAVGSSSHRTCRFKIDGSETAVTNE